MSELEYKSNSEFDEYVKSNDLQNNIVEDKKIDFEAIYKEFESIEPTIAHKANPIYIKVIEALKNA